MTQQYCLAFMAAWLSSTGISHHDLLSPISSVKSSLTLGLLYTPQTPTPSHCTFQGPLILLCGMYGCGKNCLIVIPFRLPQISCFTLSLKCFSSDSDNCPSVGIGLLFHFPHLPSRSSPSNTPVLSPSSFILQSFA